MTRTTTAVMATPATIMRMIIITTMIMAIITITAVTITTTSIASTSITTAIPMLMTTNSSEPADAPGAMSESETAALYRLMTWLSPSFPVGAFSYSSGIEWAVEAGDIADAASLRGWLAAMYLFFRVTARIEASELIDPTPFLQREGFVLARRHFFKKGMLTSEMWRRNV